jgi:hypothetical protein
MYGTPIAFGRAYADRSPVHTPPADFWQMLERCDETVSIHLKKLFEKENYEQFATHYR